MKLGIIGAMSVEIETLKENMLNLQESTRCGMTFFEGTLENLPVVVVVCGVGKVNAALCVQVLCDCFNVSHIVNTGVAGSLCAELDIGDFVISRDAIYHDFTCGALNPAYSYLTLAADGMDDGWYDGDWNLVEETVQPGAAFLIWNTAATELKLQLPAAY